MKPTMLLLRLYPRRWRARYGDELIALVESMASSGRGRWSLALDLVRGAFDARIHGLGRVASSPEDPAAHRLVTASWAFALFGGAGLAFQKLSEDGPFASAARQHPSMDLAFEAVRAFGLAALVLVAVVAVPSAWHALRVAIGERRWSTVGVLASPGLVTAAAAALVVAVARSGGSDPVHSTANVLRFVATCVLAAAALASWPTAATVVVRRRRAPQRAPATLTVALLAAAMCGAAFALLLWGVALTVTEPGLFHSDNGVFATAAPASWIAILVAMAAAAAATTTACTR